MKVHCVILLATLALSAAHIGGGPMIQDVNTQVYCGRNLAIAISELCLLQKPEKRSEGRLYDVPPYYNAQEYGWPWLTPHKARALALPSRGKRIIAGVADECCDKACSLDEILDYCN